VEQGFSIRFDRDAEARATYHPVIEAHTLFEAKLNSFQGGRAERQWLR
jgi:hypothetical protein